MSVTEEDLPSLTIVKVGGSLLDWPELPAQLDRWCRQQTGDRYGLLAGGGGWVEQLRQHRPTRWTPTADMHWRAIEMMAIAAHVLACRTGLPLVEATTAEAFCNSPAADASVVNVCRWLRTNEAHLPGLRLPVGWHVTSDSIAARLAVCWQAEELVLLKSCAAESDCLRAWSEQGLVDGWFTQAARGLRRVSVVNLRDANHTQTWCSNLAST